MLSNLLLRLVPSGGFCVMDWATCPETVLFVGAAGGGSGTVRTASSDPALLRVLDLMLVPNLGGGADP